VRAAFFDLDKTVIAKSSLVAFARNSTLAAPTSAHPDLGVLSQTIFMRFGADEEKLEKIRESVLQITKGWITWR